MKDSEIVLRELTDDDVNISQVRRLMRATWKTALIDLCSTDSQRSKDAFDWFFKEPEEPDYTFNFSTICETLGEKLNAMRYVIMMHYLQIEPLENLDKPSSYWPVFGLTRIPQESISFDKLFWHSEFS